MRTQLCGGYITYGAYPTYFLMEDCLLPVLTLAFWPKSMQIVVKRQSPLPSDLAALSFPPTGAR